ncbi:MAG: sporulation protein YlmC with PRC-barrel domain [Paraglaciecola sp.]|jgi:sporulation protein YlmC with PRC-barrel domain
MIMYAGLRDIKRFTIAATDGDIGVSQDFLFDDRTWTIRYMYVDTHKWLPLGEKVLISPISLREIDREEERVHVALSTQQVKDSPSIDEHKPVSREYEELLFTYLGYGYYWTGPGAWGEYAHPTALAQPKIDAEQDDEEPAEHHSHANHLRSIDELQGYEVKTVDGTIGQIHDLILNTANWKIPLIVLDTHRWLPGSKKVFISPKHIRSINWLEQDVICSLKITEIEHCPECDHQRLNDANYVQEIIQELRALGR